MDASTIGLLGLAALLVLIALRVPVAIAMGSVGAIGFGLINGFDALGFVMGSAPFQAVFPYTLSVVPLFVLMGVFATHAGLSRNLYDGFYAFFGHLRGGLAMATVGACAGFGAICGSSIATAATMCRVALPEMRRRGYADSLATGAIAAGGTLGIMIPPSIIMVIYGLLTETSIGKLFIAGVLPGLLATALYMAAIAFVTWRNPKLGPAGPRYDWRQTLAAVRRIWDVILLFAVVIGGIYFGWFAPTEAAAVGAFGAFAFALARKRLNKTVMRECIAETASTTGMIFLILIGANVFNYFMDVSTLPQLLVATIEGSGLDPYVVLVLILAFYVVLGTFFEELSMILLTIPFVFPLIKSLGFDPIWFGILIVTIVEIGLISPPVGMNLFVVQGVARDVPQGTVMRGVIPFVLADIIRLALLVAFPWITLVLPSMMD
ncbi:MAG TPA: TRAP transporter large permease [Alphaproteobacteria bacterium]